MSWVNFDDRFHWDPRIASLSSEAYRLFCGGWSVCCAHGTGVVVPRPRFVQAAVGVKNPRRALSELLQTELWEAVPDGWRVEFEGLVRPVSEAKREAARRAGEASGAARRAGATERTVQDSFNETGTKPERNPSRTDAGLCAGNPIPEPEPYTGTTCLPLGLTPLRGDTSPGRSANSAAEPEGVETLCRRMQALVAARARRPEVTQTWRHDARLLLTRDKRPLDEALELMAWAAEHRFWRRNVLGIPKFREQYDRLLMEMRDEPPLQLQRGRTTAATEQARRLEALADAMEAQGG